MPRRIDDSIYGAPTVRQPRERLNAACRLSHGRAAGVIRGRGGRSKPEATSRSESVGRRHRTIKDDLGANDLGMVAGEGEGLGRTLDVFGCWWR